MAKRQADLALGVSKATEKRFEGTQADLTSGRPEMKNELSEVILTRSTGSVSKPVECELIF